MTPAEVEARTAEALKGIENLNSEAPAPAAAPAKEETPGAPGSRTAQGGAEDPVEAAGSPELDARALADLLIEAKLEAAAADFIPSSRAAVARLLRPHAAFSKDGVTLGGKPLTRESVLECLGPIAEALLPAKGVSGSGARAPRETRGADPNAWLTDQESFEKQKKAIRGQGPQ